MKKGFFAVFIFLVLPLFSAAAQNEMFKALFIFNFTKNVEWPAEMRQGDFVIMVYGDSPIVAELEKVTAGKKVGQQNIAVKKAGSPDDADKCHILYLSSGKSDDVGRMLPKVESKPVLLVTDKEGLAQQGACINFVIVGGKLNFEINKSRFQKQKLQMSSSLANLGIVI
jgi:hypothetical protein